MIAVVVWFASSAWAVVLLKRVLTPDDLTGAVIDATFAQLLCGFIGAAVYVRACEKEDGDGGVAVATGTLVLGSACNAIGMAATNWAVVVGGASLSQVIKFAEPMVTVGLAAILLREWPGALRIACVAVASAGAYFAATTGTPAAAAAALSSPRAATAATAAMLAAFPLRNVCAKRAGIAGPELYGAMSRQGAAVFAPLVAGRAFLEHDRARSPSAAFAAMAVLHATYNLFSFRVLADVPVVTHAQLRLGKRVFSLVVTAVALRDVVPHPRAVVGLVAAVTGLAGYAQLRAAATSRSLRPVQEPERIVPASRCTVALGTGAIYIIVAVLLVPIGALPHAGPRPWRPLSSPDNHSFMGPNVRRTALAALRHPGAGACAMQPSWRAASFCALLGGRKDEFQPLCNAGRHGLGTFVHYSTHTQQSNAGDSVLPRATRMAFEYFFGIAPEWVLRDVRHTTTQRDVYEANARASAVVVGGGGLFYPANRNSQQNISGWQWPVHRSHIMELQAPLILFAVGWNEFRGQAPPPAAQWGAYLASLGALAARRGGGSYVTLRESYSLNAVVVQAPALPLRYQPDATTLLATLQPCLASTVLVDQPPNRRRGRGVLSVNLADDQAHLRLGPPAAQASVLASLETWLTAAYEHGWEIHIVLQATTDRRLLDHLRRRAAFPFKTVIFAITQRSAARASSERVWLDVIEYYRGVTVAASSRGHGVMIPFGLHVATISLVTHEKVRAFAHDIGHLEWAVELAPEHRPAGAQPLAEELLSVLDAIDTNRTGVYSALIDAQRHLAAVTAENMLMWAPVIAWRRRNLDTQDASQTRLQ